MPSSSTRSLSPTRWGSRIRTWAGVCLITALFTFVVAEIGLRVTGYEYPNFYQYDSVRGCTHQKNASGWWRAEGEAYVQINSQGLRDREHEVAKPAHRMRIAVLGDSYAEALQLPMDQTFWAQMERRLASCPRFSGKTVEVINFGVSSYGTANEYLTLEHDVWRYSPDIILLALLTGNDLRDNSTELDQLTGPRPFYLLENGRLVLDQARNQPPSVKQRLWSSARSYSRVAQLIHRMRDLRAMAESRGRRANTVGGLEPGLDDAIYQEPSTPEWRDAWSVTEAIVSAMHDQTLHHNAEFWLATLSNSIQVDIDASKREAFLEAHNLPDLFYPDRRLERFAHSHSIPSVILAPKLSEVAGRLGRCVHGFPNLSMCEGHWNADGHRAAGEILSRAICDGPVIGTTVL